MGRGRDHIDRCNAAQNPLPQWLNDVTTFNQRCHHKPRHGAALRPRHDEILSHVHQAACQITRVRSLQGRIRQSLTRTMRRNEVLQYVQPFPEIRCNGCFNDGAVRLSHQAAHAGQLPNLSGGAPRTRVGHHIDGIERFLLNRLARAVSHGLYAQLVHHRFSDLVIGPRPDIHNLVVALTVSD